MVAENKIILLKKNIIMKLIDVGRFQSAYLEVFGEGLCSALDAYG